MTSKGSLFQFPSKKSLVPALAAFGLGISGLTIPVGAQAQLRCDLKLNTTPGSPGGAAACLDLVALQNGGPAVQTANNATRISTDGFRLCKNAFSVNVPAGADVVFIYDNSGSMFSTYAQIDSAANDTTYHHKDGCSGSSSTIVGPMTYGTLAGPRQVTLLTQAANCSQYAGDPYHARASVIQQGIDYLRLASPTSTAGAVAFAGTIDHLQPLLQLNTQANADAVKNSIKMDSVDYTNYEIGLRQAYTWFNDPALVKTSKKAIVFISDGEPNRGNYAAMMNRNIPIYTIALGHASVAFNEMQNMSTLTGGQFFRVSPDNIVQMNAVMQQIIQAITVVNLPSAIEVTNNTFAPPMVSRSAGMSRNPDSSVSLVMDSIIALKQGANSITVKVTMSPSDVDTYTFNIQADGPTAPQTTEQLTCYPMPTLALLNQAGGIDSVYPSGPTQYDVRLTRATSDLNQVVVNAVSRDTSRGSTWGDDENLVLPQVSSAGGLTTNRKENQAFNGGSTSPVKGNNTLEAAPNGEVTLTWVHPRDDRERATFTLPGRKIPVTPGFIDMVRATDVPKGGITIEGNITNPIVIRGISVFTKNGNNVTLVDKGNLFNPHNISDANLNPVNTPTFVFKTASAFEYDVSVFDHLGQFLCSQSGKVDSTEWERMRGGADSLAVAMSILPIAKTGQPFGTGVYIMKATVKTKGVTRSDPGRPVIVTPATRIAVNRFGYRR